MDVVKCVNADGMSMLTEGVHYQCENWGASVVRVAVCGEWQGAFSYRFELMKKKDNDMQYSFYASSIDAIDVELVRDGLTRKKPMAYLVVPGVEEYKVVLHDYVWRKAQNSGMVEGHFSEYNDKLERCFQDEDCTLVLRKDMTKLVSLVKEIVRSPWRDKETGKDIQVKATYVEV